MRILVTNDDGIESEGLHVLAQRLTDVGEVTVVAPSGEYSGAGAAVGHLGAGIPDVYEVRRSEMPDVAGCYHLDGPPALATLLACQGAFGGSPDLVVSGINPGWNVGHAVHFSGTVGAGITAQVFGIAAIAVSQHRPGPVDLYWRTAAEAAVAQIARAVETASLLSINVPNLPADRIVGTVDASLSDRIPYSLHSARLHEIESGRHEVRFEVDGPYDRRDGNDTSVVEAGFIAVTPLVPTHAAAST